ncbi:lipid II:glycine glycyltransferase FemX [Kiloniella sp. b19]|uniref:lipid II:glycine glycyltransferase FemX n=1 Tax=Kiloniella sp. GXU_MW_B19 TaxID=3141326 RepID=UPI0031DA56AB
MSAQNSSSSSRDKIELKWDAVKIREWRELTAKAGRSNLLQTWPYAQTLMMTERQRAYFGTFHKGREIIGICQVIQQKVLGFYHIVRVHRGPLWTSDSVTEQDKREALQLLRKSFPRRPWRRIHFLLEIPEDETNRKELAELGYTALSGEGYHSAWLDLGKDEETLLADFKGRWRGALNKSLKQGLSLEIDRQGKHLGWLMQHNELDKQLKNFRGPSMAKLAHICRFTRDKNEFLLLRALKDKRPVAAIVLVRHEKAATYLVGWSSPEGRSAAAHNFLLWEGLKILKKEDTRWLDLGGMNEKEAEGVTAFKRGMSPEEYHLIGNWC